MNKLKLTILMHLFAVSLFTMYAQNGEKAYRFLSLPTSTHVNALGGSNVSLIENDVSLVFHNPATLGPEMDMNLNVNYMSYIDDIGLGSVMFAKGLSEISAFAVGVNYMNYGKFEQKSIENMLEGEFSAKDIAVNAVYSRHLSHRLRGGVTTKFIYSSYESYSSSAIGVDVGLSYYKSESDFSAGLVIKNMGTQISSYNEKRLGLPWDVQVGMTKRLSHAPIRFSLTGVYLTQWNFARINEANGVDKSNDSFGKTLWKHLVIGADFIPSENFTISLGYNPKVNADMRLTEGNKWAGFSAGAGIRVSKLNIGFSVSPYHPSATAYHFSLGIDLSKY